MTELTNHRATRTRDRNRDQGTISGSICVYFKYENEGFLYKYVINNKMNWHGNMTRMKEYKNI